MATATATSLSKLESILGTDARSLLEHKCETIPKSQLHLPGPDFVTRIFATSDRPTRVLRSLESLFDHGRLAGTGYLSILPVDQGIEHSAGASFAANPAYFDGEKIVELAIGAVGGAVVGARMTRRVSDAGLRRAFGVLAIVVGLLMIGEAALHALGTPIHFGATLRLTGLSLWGLAFVVGAVAGILSGLLGIGGGAIMIPAMTLLMGLSQHLAQGTSLLVIIPTAISGSITHFRMGNIRLETAGWLSVGGVVGAVAGASLALASPDQVLRLLFGGYLTLTGLQMMQSRPTDVIEPTMASR